MGREIGGKCQIEKKYEKLFYASSFSLYLFGIDSIVTVLYSTISHNQHQNTCTEVEYTKKNFFFFFWFASHRIYDFFSHLYQRVKQKFIDSDSIVNNTRIGNSKKSFLDVIGENFFIFSEKTFSKSSLFRRNDELFIIFYFIFCLFVLKTKFQIRVDFLILHKEELFLNSMISLKLPLSVYKNKSRRFSYF